VISESASEIIHHTPRESYFACWWSRWLQAQEKCQSPVIWNGQLKKTSGQHYLLRPNIIRQ